MSLAQARGRMVRQSSSARDRTEESRVVNLQSAERGGGFDTENALEAFHSEADWPEEPHAPKPAPVTQATNPAVALPRAVGISLPVRQEPRAPRAWLTILLCAIALTEAPFVAMWLFHDHAAVPSTTVSSMGIVYVESEPSGLEVLVNGAVAGRTPARLSLPRGAVELQLRYQGSVRVLPLVVNPDETMRLRVEFPVTPESLRSSLHVVVTPSGMTSVPAALSGSLARAGQLPLP